MRYCLVLLLLVFLHPAEGLEFFLKPGVRCINTGLGEFWVFQGGEIGTLYKDHHRFSLDAYFFNDVENTKYYTDSVTGQDSWSDEIRHYGNVYFSYDYEWQIIKLIRLSAGLSVGFKYAEYDRNFDTTVVMNYSTDSMTTTINGEVPLRHEAEGRFMGFGGPRLELQLGYKKVFFRTLLLLNIGRLENYGYYKSRSADITNLYFESPYTLEKIEVEESGWQKKSGSTLFTIPKVLPELTLGIAIFL